MDQRSRKRKWLARRILSRAAGPVAYACVLGTTLVLFLWGIQSCSVGSEGRWAEPLRVERSESRDGWAPVGQ